MGGRPSVRPFTAFMAQPSRPVNKCQDDVRETVDRGGKLSCRWLASSRLRFPYLARLQRKKRPPVFNDRGTVGCLSSLSPRGFFVSAVAFLA